MARSRAAAAAVRALRGADLERVVAIDRAHTARGRERFFAKRLGAAERDPGDFIHLAVESGGALVGFALAHVLSGEFGREEPVLVLDAMAVDPGSRAHGHGRALLGALAKTARERGLHRLLSQAEWRNHQLLGFFDSAGFELAGRLTLERAVGRPLIEPAPEEEPGSAGSAREIDYSTAPPDFGPLARDRVPVRSMMSSDLRALVAIDREITGRDRRPYFERKLREALQDSDVRVSLVAELDGVPAGFIMARVDLGAFGRIEPAAMLDTIGVGPEHRGRAIGRALLSQLLANLASLRVEKLLTEIEWSDRDLLGYLAHCGFGPSSRLCFDYRLP